MDAINKLTPEQRQAVMMQAQQEANSQIMREMINKMAQACFQKCAGTSVRAYMYVLYKCSFLCIVLCCCTCACWRMLMRVGLFALRCGLCSSWTWFVRVIDWTVVNRPAWHPAKTVISKPANKFKRLYRNDRHQCKHLVITYLRS